MALGKTAKYYRKNKAAYEKKKEYDKKFGAKPEQKKKKAELGRINYEHDKKNGKSSRNGKHYDHAVGRYVDSKTNQSRKEKSRLKGSKRKTKK